MLATPDLKDNKIIYLKCFCECNENLSLSNQIFNIIINCVPSISNFGLHSVTLLSIQEPTNDSQLREM